MRDSLHLDEIEVYVQNRKDTLLRTVKDADYDRNLLDKCRSPPSRSKLVWWNEK